MKKTLTIAYSPCPNDCFIFAAIALNKIDTQGIDFKIILEDVEALNQHAVNQTFDITKLSFHAYAYLTEHYILLNSGSALGFGVGPILISKKEIPAHDVESINQLKIAIPGILTTANFLLDIAYPHAKNKTPILFSEIESQVLNGTFDAGLIIHENRFTFQEKGLHQIIDCGEFWEKLIHAPIPLGGIVMKRKIEEDTIKTVDQIIKKSIAYAYANKDIIMPYVRQNAQEMNESVMQKHIDLYVNEYTLNLGETGKRAIDLMFNKALENKLINTIFKPILISH